MLNTKQIRCLFDKLNKEFFNNALPQPNGIEFHYVKSYLGQFQSTGQYGKYGICVIRFSTAWEMTDFEVEKVLIHEMIHEWQWTVGHSDHHGTWFKLKANEINCLTNNKYNISRVTILENNTCLKDAKKKFSGGLIIYTHRSRPGVTFGAICPSTSLEHIKSWFPKNKNITSSEFYIFETNEDNCLPGWTKSVKNINGYPIEKEEFINKYKKSIVRKI